MNGLVHNVVTLLAPEIRRHGVGLRLALGEDLPPGNAQPIQIEQVIFNLARNAVEAMEEVAADSRELTITTSLTGDGLLGLSVRDSGPGLSAAIGGEPFNPFVTTKADGMGLGLSISQGIIDSHGGRLRVESRPGDGALFHFTLPVYGASND